MKKWRFPECLFCKCAEGCTLGDKCSFEHRWCEEQPRKRSKRSGGRSAVAFLKETKNLGCVFQDVVPPRSSSILRKSSNTTKPIRCVRFSTAVLRNANLRHQNQLLNKICHGDSHQRSPNAPKFKDRSQEDRLARALGSRSGVETGKENPEVKGKTQSHILLTFGKSSASLHHPKFHRRKGSLW